MSDDKQRLLDAATTLGLRASRDRDGTVTLRMPAANLPPNLREFAERIAVTEVDPISAAAVLARVLLWAKRRGHPSDQVLRESAAERIADPGTVDAIAAAIDREAGLAAETAEGFDQEAARPGHDAPLAPVPIGPEPAVGDELRGYLTLLARQSGGHRPDSPPVSEVQPPTTFLEKLRTGAYPAPRPLVAPRDFPDFVRRVGACIDRALERHGETPRLRQLKSLIDVIRDRGVESYERDDPARAARLTALGPEIIDRLDGYAPDPDSAEDRPLQPRQTARI